MKNTVVCAAFQSLDLTKLTYESLLRTVAPDTRIILINNGSTDGTKEWIENLAMSSLATDTRTTLVHSPKNEGCGIGRNIGSRLISPDSEYITFVDNDIVATSGWEEAMTSFMDAHPEIGICGCSTNWAGTPQKLDPVRYTKLGHPLPEKVEDIEPFAQWFRSTHKGQWSYVPRGFVVIGFCMMIRKKCFDQLRYPDGGIFDEQYKYYGKEDNDLCIRATETGWKLAYFNGCFVFHWGSKSLDALSKAGVDWGAEWRKNDKVFEEKWKR